MTDMPAPPYANRPSQPFQPAWFGENPAVESPPGDPHGTPFTMGEGPTISAGETAANIVTDPPTAISWD